MRVRCYFAAAVCHVTHQVLRLSIRRRARAGRVGGRRHVAGMYLEPTHTDIHACDLLVYVCLRNHTGGAMCMCMHALFQALHHCTQGHSTTFSALKRCLRYAVPLP